MAKVMKAETKMRATQKQDSNIHNCPNCNSDKTNQVTKNNYFCMECDIEFNSKTGRVYTIEWNGGLVDYNAEESYVNEFMGLA